MVLWTGDPTLVANTWAVRTALAQPAVPGGNTALLQIIAACAGTPDAAARAYMQDVYKRELRGVRRFVSVPLGDSFRQAIVRTIMRSMALFAGKSAFLTVVSTLDAGYDAVLQGRATPTRAELAACVLKMFAALDVAAP